MLRQIAGQKIFGLSPAELFELRVHRLEPRSRSVVRCAGIRRHAASYHGAKGGGSMEAYFALALLFNVLFAIALVGGAIRH